MSAQQPVKVFLNHIDAHYEEMGKQLKDELAKGDRANLSVLNSIASRIVAYGDQHSVRNDHNHVYDRSMRIKKLVEEIVKSHKNRTEEGLGYTAAAICFAAAFCGLSPLFRCIPEGISKVLSTAAQPLSGAGTGFNYMSQAVKNQQDALRQMLNHERDVHQRSQSNRDEASKQTHGQARSAIDHARDANAAEHRARETAMGG